MTRYGASRVRVSRQAGLRLARGVQLKYFLRYQNLAAGMSNSRSAVIRRILDYVDAGKLTGEAVDRAIVEFLEYRNKRAYLYTADPTRLSHLDLSRFTRGIKDWCDARIVPAPDAPRENYAYVDADALRVTFSETHRHPAVHLASERVGWRRVGKVIVLDADRRSGFVSLSLDAPGRITLTDPRAGLLRPLSAPRRGTARHRLDPLPTPAGTAAPGIGRPGSAPAGKGIHGGRPD